jgi:ribose/xylose/arabinose/galactoside ABC-type transport system permease subunit
VSSQFGDVRAEPLDTAGLAVGLAGPGRPSARLVRAVDLVGQWAAPGATLLVLLVAALAVQAFFRPANLTSVMIQVAVLGIVAIGQTLVLLVRGIDLSVNSVLALGAVIVVQTESGGSTAVNLLEACLLALMIGVANGLLVTKRRVPPFIATFGMLVFVAGARLAYTSGQASGTVPDWMRAVGVGQIGFIPAATLVWLGITALVSVVLHFTRYGRWIYAVGGNPLAARYAGLPVDAVVIACYAACSLLALAAGIVLSGYIGYVDLRLGADFNVNSIAAAIVGGTTFTGGRGNLLGTAAGVILLTVLLNLVVVAGLPINWQYAVQGAVLIVATAIQGLRERLLSS